MRRLKCEKETIILTNEDDGFYDVYTFNQNLQKRFRGFAAKYPDDGGGGCHRETESP